MKTPMKATLLVLVLSTLASASDKGWSNHTGNDLLPVCSVAVDFLDKKNVSRDDANDALECLQYVSGFLDGYAVASTVEKGKPFICFPKDSNTGQMVRVVVKWLRDHPEKLNLAASDCVFAAVGEAYMCKYPK
jgi:Rap1a immunity proteins